MKSHQQRDRNGRFSKQAQRPTRMEQLEQIGSVVMIVVLILSMPFLIGLLQAIMEVSCG